MDSLREYQQWNDHCRAESRKRSLDRFRDWWPLWLLVLALLAVFCWLPGGCRAAEDPLTEDWSAWNIPGHLPPLGYCIVCRDAANRRWQCLRDAKQLYVCCPHAWERAERDAWRRWQVWDCLASLQQPMPDLDVMGCLLDLLGAEDYLRGRWPVPVPCGDP